MNNAITEQKTRIARIFEDSEVAGSKPRQQPQHDAPQKPTRRRKLATLIVALIVANLAGWAVYHRSRSDATAAAGAATVRGQTLPVPVVEGVVATSDVPIYVDGLGTVQAFNTVTVHTRVDGQLIKVAFTEGQEVKTGDVLALLDPAPYQAALDQAAASSIVCEPSSNG